MTSTPDSDFDAFFCSNWRKALSCTTVPWAQERENCCKNGESSKGRGKREQGTGKREQGAGNREQGAGNREQRDGHLGHQHVVDVQQLRLLGDELVVPPQPCGAFVHSVISCIQSCWCIQSFRAFSHVGAFRHFVHSVMLVHLTMPGRRPSTQRTQARGRS
jgi:hypothetical protein